VAAAYVSSPVHATGDDLELLAAWAEGGRDRDALDVATGGGHTALALARTYGRVVASDLTQEMLDAAEQHIGSAGVQNVQFRIAVAEALPFPEQSFDAVSCRIAPHHFQDIAEFLREVRRVLKPGGILLLEDNVVPETPLLGALLNRVEKLRDPSHCRSLSPAEWLEKIQAAGLTVEVSAMDRKRHEMSEWLDRSRTPTPAREEIRILLKDGGAEAAAAFLLEFDPRVGVVAFTDEKLLVKARKRTESVSAAL